MSDWLSKKHRLLATRFTALEAAAPAEAALLIELLSAVPLDYDRRDVSRETIAKCRAAVREKIERLHARVANNPRWQAALAFAKALEPLEE